MTENHQTDYKISKNLADEADSTIEYLKKIYPTLGARDFFQIAVLRSLAIIIKLLLNINRKC